VNFERNRLLYFVNKLWLFIYDNASVTSVFRVSKIGASDGNEVANQNTFEGYCVK